MRKVLDFGNPYVKCYNHHAFITGIIRKAPIPQEWIYNHFIQVFYNPDGVNKIDFVEDYMFHKEGIFMKGYHNIPEIYKEKHCLVDIFKTHIDMNAYIIGEFDEYYIPDMKLFEKSHYIHNYLLFGYDDKKKILYLAGYDKNHRWFLYNIPYKTFIKSLVSDNEKFINYNTLILNPYYTSEISIEIIKNSILSYLESMGISYKSFIYGEKGVSEYFAFVLNQIKKGEELHIPSIYVLYEHKLMMLERLKLLAMEKTLNINKYIIHEYDYIKEQYHILVNLYLKYQLTKDKKYADNINLISSSSIGMERVLLEEIYNKLDKAI